MTRTVYVKTSQSSNPQTIETDAVTWKQLKAALREQQISTDGMAAVVMETNNSLELDDAVLPTETFVLLLTSRKSKGASDYSGMGYAQLRRLCSERKISGTNGKTTEQLAKLLKEHDASQGTTPSTNDLDNVEPPQASAQSEPQAGAYSQTDSDIQVILDLAETAVRVAKSYQARIAQLQGKVEELEARLSAAQTEQERPETEQERKIREINERFAKINGTL